MCDHDGNSVKEIEVNEDDGPGKNPEDSIEEEDGIVLDVVEESVRQSGVMKKFRCGWNPHRENAENDIEPECLTGIVVKGLH